jgi:hypothetical protein
MTYKCDIFDDVQVCHLWWLTSVSSLMTYKCVIFDDLQVCHLWWLTDDEVNIWCWLHVIVQCPFGTYSDTVGALNCKKVCTAAIITSYMKLYQRDLLCMHVLTRYSTITVTVMMMLMAICHGHEDVRMLRSQSWSWWQSRSLRYHERDNLLYYT